MHDMKHGRSFTEILLITSLVGFMLLSGSAVGQTTPDTAAPQPIAKVKITKTAVEWTPQLTEKYDYLTLTIARPDGSVVRAQFKPGEQIIFSEQSAARFVQEKLNDGRDPASKKGRTQPPPKAFADGLYKSELQVMPASPPLVHNAAFWIRDGALLLPPKDPEPPPQALSSQQPELKKEPVDSPELGN